MEAFMGGAFERRWVSAVRALLRVYPFKRGRVRLSGVLLTGSFRGPFPGPPQRIVSAIPEGRVVRCRNDVLLRLHRDEAFIWPYLLGEYEEAVGRAFGMLIKPGDVVVDAGASFGWYSTLFARWVGSAGSVHAFEPVPKLAELAQDTLRLNGVEAMTSLNVEGLGSESGEFIVYTFAGLPLGHASASDLGRSDAQAHQCRLTTLDTYVRKAGLDRLDFLKVDVEGGERDVFLGGRQVLARHKPLIGFEVNIHCLRGRDLMPSDVFDLLRSCGYGFFWAIHEEGHLESVREPPFRTQDYLAAVDPDHLRPDATPSEGYPSRIPIPMK